MGAQKASEGGEVAGVVEVGSALGCDATLQARGQSEVLPHDCNLLWTVVDGKPDSTMIRELARGSCPCRDDAGLQRARHPYMIELAVRPVRGSGR